MLHYTENVLRNKQTKNWNWLCNLIGPKYRQDLIANRKWETGSSHHVVATW